MHGQYPQLLRYKDGNNVSGVKISVKQKSHEFKFGANLFMLDEFENEEKNELYKPTICKVLPITQAEEAHDILYNGQNVGKVVLKVK